MCVINIILLILFSDLFSFLPPIFSFCILSQAEKMEKWEGEEKYLFKAQLLETKCLKKISFS